jgi:hypothetical protein
MFGNRKEMSPLDLFDGITQVSEKHYRISVPEEDLNVDEWMSKIRRYGDLSPTKIDAGDMVTWTGTATVMRVEYGDGPFKVRSIQLEPDGSFSVYFYHKDEIISLPQELFKRA